MEQDGSRDELPPLIAEGSYKGGECSVSISVGKCTLTPHKGAAVVIPFESVASYEAARWEGVGPDWGLKVVAVTWRMYLWGKTVTPHVVRLRANEGEDAQDQALDLMKGFDHRVLAWQRAKLGLDVKDLSVAKATLLRPNGGIGVAQGTIKRLSDGELDVDRDTLSSAMTSMSLSSSSSSSSSEPTREHPGTVLFCDEEALSLPGLVAAEQRHMYGVRYPGFWSVWKTWNVSVFVSQELVPGILLLNPAALVLMLPSAALFTPFPIQQVATWGSSNDAFSFKHQAAKGVYNVLSFVNLDAPAIEAKIGQLIDFTLAGGLPQNPFPLTY